MGICICICVTIIIVALIVAVCYYWQYCAEESIAEEMHCRDQLHDLQRDVDRLKADCAAGSAHPLRQGEQ